MEWIKYVEVAPHNHLQDIVGLTARLGLPASARSRFSSEPELQWWEFIQITLVPVLAV